LYKRTQFARSSRRRWWLARPGALGPPGTSVRNKANSCQSDTKGKSFMEKELWRIGHPKGLGKTKPIGGGVSSWKCQVSSEQRPAVDTPASNSPLHASNSRPDASNEANCGTIRTATYRLPPSGQFCKTKPIGHQRAAGQDFPLFQYPMTPRFRSLPDRAERSQSPRPDGRERPRTAGRACPEPVEGMRATRPSSREAPIRQAQGRLGDATRTVSILGAQRGNPPPYAGRSPGGTRP
jgi:hypothetical protein